MSTFLEHKYRPRGACRELFNTKVDEVLVSGPAGTGKSRACLEKLHLMALANPGMRGLIVRKTVTSLTSTALVTWKTHVIAEALEAGLVQYYGGSAVEPAQYRYTNGSVVIVGGMDRSTRIMSSEYDVIYVQEATELVEDDWEALTTRLRNGRVSFQQLMADCNPDRPTHWLKVRCDNNRTQMLESKHEDNPLLFADDELLTPEGEAYLKKLENLSGVRHLRLRKGIWAGAEGLIYDEFENGVHLLNTPKTPPAEWTRYWSIDFGYTNPFVCQFWAENPDGKLFLYREIYKTARTVYEHAQEIKRVVTWQDDPRIKDKERIGTWREPKPRAIICDHDAEGRAVLEQEIGISTTPAHKSVLEGIQAVQKRIKEQRIQLVRDVVVNKDEELRTAKKPTSTAEEITGYIWTDKGTKEAPLKEDDHGMDAMRYLVAHLDLVAKPRIRWL